jgi:hypothetical protein
MKKGTFLGILGKIVCLGIVTVAGLTQSEATSNEKSYGGVLRDAGYVAKVHRIDGPDFFGEEPEFEYAYKILRSRYGNDYLPVTLPEELRPIRDRIARYINKEPSRALTGAKRYESGPRGVSNGDGFRYWPSELPTKITRLSYCFGISPRVLTALIEKESQFIAEAQSSTGAVGFMQITNVAAVEVMEQLGYPNPYASYSKESAELYKDYISCYLGDEREWVDPWVKSPTTETKDGQLIVSAKCTEAFNNCKRGSKKLRTLKDPYDERFDKWLTGQLPNSSHDNGLIFGAILLKFHVGHYGYVTGVENFNGDSVKRSYRKKILGNAVKVSSHLVRYELFGQSYQIFHNQSEERLDALDTLARAAHLWSDVNEESDANIDEQLKSLELPGTRESAVDI